MSDQNMKKRNLALIAGILAIGLVAASIAGGHLVTASAQEQQAKTTDDRPTVSTSGSGTVKVDPDKVSVNIGVETRSNSTAADAVVANADLMKKVLAALKAVGVTDDQIATSSYSVYPIYETRTNGKLCIDIYPQPPECQLGQVIVGYMAVNSLTVTLDSGANVGAVIDAAVKAGANNVSGASFFISQEKQQEIRDSLIEKAIANAKSRADKAAAAVEMHVVGVKSINLNDVYFPVFYKELPAASSAGGGTQILPGQQEVTMNVQVTFVMG
jgi:uncharacterized protein YggE